MITHLIETADGPSVGSSRDSLGGAAVLPLDVAEPRCECGEAMALFFQFDVRKEFGLPFETGSHFSLFMCPKHNDAPDSYASGQPLPRGYWDERRMIGGGPRFYAALLHRPGAREKVLSIDPYIEPRALRFAKTEERPDRAGIQAFKTGGQPSWAQKPETHRCSCGAEMRFLAQVPADMGFQKRSEAPPQPDSFSADDYCLFLGNETYVFACEAQCDPRAVHVVVQN